MKIFDKPFTQQDPMPEAAIDRAVEILRSGRLHRYNTLAGEVAEATLLEESYAAYQGAPYCLATTSGGTALQIALRAIGVGPGDAVLTNAYTLAPVPGAIHAVGGRPVLVETRADWTLDQDHLRAQAQATGARVLMLSHMRGHLTDMTALMAFCDGAGIRVIEDCAHTMGAWWGDTRSGNFGLVACFSTQTYKHMNSGEGGLLTTSDPEVAARATILSGSYMLYERHGARPGADVFTRVRTLVPNCSSRMDNLRAALIRAQLPHLEDNIARWNARYQALEDGLRGQEGFAVRDIPVAEFHVGSSFQFHYSGGDVPAFVQRCADRGVEIKWFGADQPAGFTSRYDSWHYLGDMPRLAQTEAVLATTCDIRVPLTFSVEDCQLIAEIMCDCG